MSSKRGQPYGLFIVFINVGIMLLSALIEEEFFGPIEFRDGPDLIFGVLFFVGVFSGIPLYLLCSIDRRLVKPIILEIALFFTISTAINILRFPLYFLYCPILTSIMMYYSVKSVLNSDSDE